MTAEPERSRKLSFLVSNLYKETAMTPKIIAATVGLSLMTVASGAAAQGHVKGAVVGGVIGAHSHHAVAGAVVGGAVGHHMAKTKAKKEAAAAAPPK